MDGKLGICGTMEIVGLDESVNRRRLGGILKSVGAYYPQLSETDFEGLEVWKGLRPCSPDGMPFIRRTKRRKNVLVATGHSMLGLSLAPLTGEMEAAILTGDELKYDMALVDWIVTELTWKESVSSIPTLRGSLLDWWLLAFRIWVVGFYRRGWGG